MNTIKHNTKWLSIILVALACFALQLIYPEWRSELKAKGYGANQPKVTICHKFGTPAENTLTVGYPAAISHIREHGDFLGACPQYDLFIDVDGIATPGRGLPQGINVQVGDFLTSWPTNSGNEGIDWFDNDVSCTWTLGDDLHLEDNWGACSAAIRNGFHDLGFDCAVLDLDGSFFQGQQVDVVRVSALPSQDVQGSIRY